MAKNPLNNGKVQRQFTLSSITVIPVEMTLSASGNSLANHSRPTT